MDVGAKEETIETITRLHSDGAFKMMKAPLGIRY